MIKKTKITNLPIYIQWTCYVVMAGVSGFILTWLTVPAALLLGPMLCAIVMGVCDVKIRMPAICFKYSQGIIGCLIAHAMTTNVLLEIFKQWDIMLIATIITIILSIVVGIISVHYGGLPGSTAAWGTSPGGASTMVAMAEAYGADVRVVATMQYIRVICVVLMAALVSHLLAPFQVHKVITEQVAVNLDYTLCFNFAMTLVVLIIGVLLGYLLPAGFLLIPMFLGTLCQLLGWVDLVLPHWMLVLAYGVIGAYIGLRFDRETLRYVMYAMPVMIFSSMLLIVLCGISALLVTWWLHVDYLSAYLATSPGGLDSLSIVAIDVNADVGLVIAMQTLRLFAVILTGATVAKYIARFAVVK